MLCHIWRIACATADIKSIIRQVSGGSYIDASFITNMRDAVDRKTYLSGWHPKEGHFNGPRYWLNGVTGRTRSIDSVTEDLLSNNGRKKAKEQFISATEWAQKRGAKVILLAASTKRLFGEDGGTLKELFPDMLFTIGDNGTMLVLMGETLRAFNEARLNPNSRIAVLGAYGLLGEHMTQGLLKAGYKHVIGAGNNAAGLRRMESEYGIETAPSFDALGKVDAVVACTHSEKILLTEDSIELIRHRCRRLLVVDVAEPSNLRADEYAKCEDVVIRQDAGNAYSPNLKYVLGAISYRMFRLTRGVTFGCFAETLALASALKRGEDVKQYDWFKVNDGNMSVVSKLFEHDGFTIPTARCFGKPVKSFNLELPHEQAARDIVAEDAF